MMGWWRWFSLRAGHHRPTINDYITKGCESILGAKLYVGNSVVRGGRFHDGSFLGIGESPDFLLTIVMPALVYWMSGSGIKPVLLSTLIAP